MPPIIFKPPRRPFCQKLLFLARVVLDCKVSRSAPNIPCKEAKVFLRAQRRSKPSNSRSARSLCPFFCRIRSRPKADSPKEFRFRAESPRRFLFWNKLFEQSLGQESRSQKSLCRTQNRFPAFIPHKVGAAYLTSVFVKNEAVAADWLA